MLESVEFRFENSFNVTAFKKTDINSPKLKFKNSKSFILNDSQPVNSH